MPASFNKIFEMPSHFLVLVHSLIFILGNHGVPIRFEMIHIHNSVKEMQWTGIGSVLDL